VTRRRKILIVTILSSVSLLIILAVLEGGARLLGFKGIPTYSHRVTRMDHPERGWRQLPNLRFTQIGTAGWVEGNSDADGFRPLVSCRDRADSPIVICVGDSTTYDAACRNEETWPEAASLALAKSGIACRMLNRGLRGYSTIQALATLREALRNPSIAAHTKAVVYHFFTNDPKDNVSPIRPRFDPAELAKENREGPLPILVVPPGPEEGRGFFGRMTDHSALNSALRSLRLDRSPKAFAAGLREWLEKCHEMLQEFESDPQQRPVMRAALQELARECRLKGVPFFVSTFPFPPWQGDESARRAALDLLGETYAEKLRVQADAFRKFEDWLRKTLAEVGGTYIDTGHSQDGVPYRDYAFSPVDFHFSAAGERRVGETIAARLSGLLR
jgi:hypothetical protein